MVAPLYPICFAYDDAANGAEGLDVCSCHAFKDCLVSFLAVAEPSVKPVFSLLIGAVNLYEPIAVAEEDCRRGAYDGRAYLTPEQLESDGFECFGAGLDANQHEISLLHG